MFQTIAQAQNTHARTTAHINMHTKHACTHTQTCTGALLTLRLGAGVLSVLDALASSSSLHSRMGCGECSGLCRCMHAEWDAVSAQVYAAAFIPEWYAVSAQVYEDHKLAGAAWPL